MAIEIATAFVQIVPSMKGVGKAIESAFGSASETAGNTAGIKAGNGFAGGFGAKLGVITGIAQSVAGKAIEAFMGLSGEITSASDSAQKFASTLNFAGVSEQQIKRLTASTQDYADKTVYDLNDIRQHHRPIGRQRRAQLRQARRSRRQPQRRRRRLRRHLQVRGDGADADRRPGKTHDRELEPAL